jgi:serine/threonine protein kinase
MADHDHSDADVPATAAAPAEMPPPSDTPDARPDGPFPDATDELLAPKLRGYEIIGRLGQGGMGTVWRAVQLSTRRAVAVKMLGPGMFGTPRARGRFDREVQLTAQLEHPDIARVYESGVAEGVYFYTMELVDGVPLDAHVSANRLPRSDVLRLMRRVCLAVQHAHQHGVIHRDLKPTNILVGADGAPKVLDFGLAKALRNDGPGAAGAAPAAADDPPLSVDGAVSGTPGFMSPEQAAGRPVDTRSDVYSLGVILYRLLTSRDPHTGARTDAGRGVNGGRNGRNGDAASGSLRAGDDSVVRPRTADHSIDRDLEALLLKALAHRPDDRYASAGELARDLGNYLNGDPLSAKRPTLTYFIRKRVRKYWLRVTAVVIVLALVVGQAAWWYQRALTARDAQATLLANQGWTQLLGRRVDLAALLGIAAVEKQDTPQTRELLVGVLNESQGLHHLLHGHRDVVCAVACSPTGDVVAAAGGTAGGSGDYLIRLWDTADGRLIAELSGHTAPVLALAFSPRGTCVASADAAGVVRLWELPSGKPIGQPLTAGHRGPVYALAFNAFGDVLASGGAGPPPVDTASTDAEFCVWDLGGVAVGTPSLKYRRAIPVGTGSPVHALAFSPDGRMLATGSVRGPEGLPFAEDFGVQLWKLDDDAPHALSLLVSKEGKLLSNGVNTLYTHSDKTHLLGGTDDGEVFVWRWPTPDEIPALRSSSATIEDGEGSPRANAIDSKKLGEGEVIALRATAAGQRLLIALSDGSVKTVSGAFGGIYTGMGDTLPVFHSANPARAAAFAEDATVWAMAGQWRSLAGADDRGGGGRSPVAFVGHGVLDPHGEAVVDVPAATSATPAAELKRRAAELVNRDFADEERGRYGLR